MRWFPQLLFVLVLAACSSSSDEYEGEEITHLQEVASSQDYDKFYFSDVKPILDNRCVTCHSCYTAPCQLNLAHIEGVQRGATKIPLYDGTRLKSASPTRLFMDAHSALDWMKKGFFPVARKNTDEISILESMVTQRAKYPGRVKIPAEKSIQCPATPKEIGEYQANFRDSGMPYGFPPLADNELKIIQRWMEMGYPKLTDERVRSLGEPRNSAPLARWEELWNSSDLRSKLVARYVYEHLFLGHLQLPELPGTFFRMVRSRTASPKPIDVIATVWPYDDPGTKIFYYRLQKVEETLTLKNHMVYPLSNTTWKRWQELFYQIHWTVAPEAFPSYEAKIAGNPFIAYNAIPAESRYRFLLDNAHFFVSSFIKGPVCEGAVAVNVIDEHFFVFFLDPAHDLDQKVPNFLQKSASDLALPAEAKNDILGARYTKFKAAQMEFIRQKHNILSDTYPRGMELSYIWDGDGKNPQSALTVFRHFNDAYVSLGIQGGPTKTVWVMDYPIFERMYYLLVAGFDVFGNVIHQATTRRYMNDLRIEAEDLFLSFMPAAYREPYRKHWYRGIGAEDKLQNFNPYSGVAASSRIPYQTKDPKSEFVNLLVNQRFKANVRGDVYEWPSQDKVLQQLTTRAGTNFVPLPDISLILVQGKGGDRLYSMIHHKEHLNVAFMIVEDSRLAKKEDHLDVIPGVHGSFPSFFLKVPEDQLETFVQDTLQLEENNPGKLNAWIAKYGILRHYPNFWEQFDHIQGLTNTLYGDASGILDLSKYMLW